MPVTYPPPVNDDDIIEDNIEDETDEVTDEDEEDDDWADGYADWYYSTGESRYDPGSDNFRGYTAEDLGINK